MMVAPSRSRALLRHDAVLRAREGVPTISGSTEPRAFEEHEERLIAIAEFRHGLTRVDARSAYRNAVSAWNRDANVRPAGSGGLQSFLRTFHACCAELGAASAPARGASRLAGLLASEDGGRVLLSLARISPESRRAFRILIGKRCDGVS